MRKLPLGEKVVLIDDCDANRVLDARWELRDDNRLYLVSGGQWPWFLKEMDRRILRGMSLLDYVLLWKLRHDYRHRERHLYVSGDHYDNRRINVAQKPEVTFDPLKRWLKNERFPGVYPSRNYRKKFDARVYWGGRLVDIKKGIEIREAIDAVIDFYAHNRDCIPYFLYEWMDAFGIPIIGEYFKTPHRLVKHNLTWTDARTVP